MVPIQVGLIQDSKLNSQTLTKITEKRTKDVIVRRRSYPFRVSTAMTFTLSTTLEDPVIPCKFLKQTVLQLVQPGPERQTLLDSDLG